MFHYTSLTDSPNVKLFTCDVLPAALACGAAAR